MKRPVFALIVGLGLAAASASAAGGARRAMTEGLRALERGDAAGADTAFGQAVEQAPYASLDPAAARYNQALALARAGRDEEAALAMQDARRTTDLDVQFRALYGEAWLRYRAGEAAMATNGAARALQDWEVARTLLRQAMVLDPADRDAKANFELAGLRAAEVRGAAAEAEAVVRRAKEAVAAGRFDEALRLLADEPEHRAWAFALRPDLEKKFADMTRRVGELAGIRTGAPAPGGAP